MSGPILNKDQIWRSEKVEILRAKVRRTQDATEIQDLEDRIQGLLTRGVGRYPRTIEGVTLHFRELARARKENGRDPLTGARRSA